MCKSLFRTFDFLCADNFLLLYLYFVIVRKMILFSVKNTQSLCDDHIYYALFTDCIIILYFGEKHTKFVC